MSCKYCDEPIQKSDQGYKGVIWQSVKCPNGKYHRHYHWPAS